jgi:hypothetical protein
MADRAPPLVAVYGKSGIGKSTDAALSFVGAGFFGAAPGALKSTREVGGFEIEATADLKTFMDVRQAIPILKKQGFLWLVFDDGSFMAENTVIALSKKLSNFKLWNGVKEEFTNLREEARYAGVGIVFNFWEQDVKLRDTTPKDREGNVKAGVEENTFTRLKGGPKLPMDLTESFPAMCDNVYRAMLEPTGTVKFHPWKGRYLTSFDEDWVAKCRDGVAPQIAPMNLGEILRFSGYDVPRLYDWQEDEVIRICSSLTDPKENPTVIQKEYTALISRGLTTQEARWTCRDAWDRGILLAHAERKTKSFFL